MKKRFLSLALSLIMVLSFAAPAFAVQAEETGPMDWYGFMEQYLADRPELKADFDADAWFADNYSYWTREEYMEAMEVDQAEFEEHMWNEYCWSAENGLYIVISNAYKAYQVDYYDETHPGELDRLDTRAMLEKAGYRDMTAETWYMEANGLSTPEEVRTSLLSAYVTARLTVEETHARFLEYQSAYPEKWAEFDADAYFEEQYGSFMTKEGYMDGYYLTEEELAETMFSNYVQWNRWSWDTGYDWPQQDQPITLVVNGETLYDAVITAGEGITYADAATLNAILGTSLEGEAVLIREAATAAGWDVTWNEMNNEVVLLDRESLLKGVLAPSDFREEWDNTTDPEEQFIKTILGEPDDKGLFTQDFSRFDEMMTRILSANKGLEGKTTRTTQTFELTLTAFNSLDGDKKYTVTVKADLLVKDQVADLTLSADLVQLWKMLPQNVKDKVAAQLPKVTFQDLPTLLSGCKARFILNMEEEALYWNIPLLALFDDSVGENTWGKVDFSGGLGTLVAVEREPVTDWNTAQRLYNNLLEESASSWWGAEDAYMDFARERILLNLVLGNDRIARRGDTLTWTMNADTLADYMALEDGYVDLENLTAANLFKELELTLSVEKNGRYSMTAALRPDMDAMAARYTEEAWYDATEAALMTWVMNLLDFRMSADASGTASRSTGAMEFHWKNQFKLELNTDSRRQTTSGDPLSAPPAGAEVVELY